MKSILKLSLVIGFLFGSMSVSAKDGLFSISLAEVNSKTLRFEVFNAENVSLYFYDEKQDEIYSEKIGNRNSVEKSYDLSTLTAGDYFLVAESDFKIEKYKVTIDKNGNVLAEKTPVLAFNKPEYTIENNIVKLHLDQVDDVTVSISDLSNNEYYKKTVKSQNGEINMKFDLNPSNSKHYIISVEKNGDVFNRLITL